MSARKKQMPVVNKRLLKQTLRGYAEMNKVTQAEEWAWAARLTSKESREIFEDLYLFWEKTGARAGGDWEALDRLKMAEMMQIQRRFVRLARRMRRR
jgi:hypothetical protein